jgi:hypothetical protein
MAYGLLVVTVLFCCVLGSALAQNHYTVWTVLLFTVSAIICLQTSYVLTVVWQFILGGNHS